MSNEEINQVLELLLEVKALVVECKELLNPPATGYDEFLATYNRIMGTHRRGDPKSKRQFNARAKEGVTIEDYEIALQNARKEEFHANSVPPFKFITPEFITRGDKLENYRSREEKKEVKRSFGGYDELQRT